jgi:predicted kinase
VLAQVARHYMPYMMVIDDASDTDYFRLSHRLNTRILYLLETADFRGRIGESVVARLEQIEKFKAKCEALRCFGCAARPYFVADDMNFFINEDNRRRIANEILYRQETGKFKDSHEGLRYMFRSHQYRNGPTLYLTIGIPGSGKSTWIDRHLPNVKRISMDRTRRELLGDEKDQSQNQHVFEVCQKELRDTLRSGESIVFDATSHTQKSRRMPLSAARDFFAWIKIIYFDVPLETALTRNASRVRKVPEEVIRQFYEELEDPEVYEGTEIQIVGQDG